MGESSADYITKLERENAAMAQRINEAVRALDTVGYYVARDGLPGRAREIETIQRDLRGPK